MVSANTCNWHPGGRSPGEGEGESPLGTEAKYQPLFGGKANWHLDGMGANTGLGGTRLWPPRTL